MSILLDSFIKLYKDGMDINNIKSINDVNYNCFLNKKGLPVVLVKTGNKNSLKHMQSLRSFHKFFQDNRYFWMIPIATLSKKIVGFVLRSYEGKKSYRTVYDYSNKIAPMFGWENFESFNLDSPIILCEGVKDAIYLQQYYPFVLSLNTSNITSLNLEIIKNLSDKVILCYDNDDVGEKSIIIDKKTLEENKMSVDILKPILKDCAEFFEDNKEEEDFLSNMKFKLKLFGGDTWN